MTGVNGGQECIDPLPILSEYPGSALSVEVALPLMPPQAIAFLFAILST